MAFHRSIARLRTAGSRSVSRVSLLLTEYGLNMTTWSDKLYPTEGLFTMVGIPTDFRSSELPMPESCNSTGVPITPADRTISCLAESVYVGAVTI